MDFSKSVSRADDLDTMMMADPLLADLWARPYSLLAPPLQLHPFVLASPHSGRLYPSTFLAQSRLAGISLRRSEDAYVDELFGGMVDRGVPLLAARFPRAYVDANRSSDELDPDMFDSPLGLPVNAASPRVSAGLGAVPRLIRDGAEIYQTRLSANDAVQRLSRLHSPYHAALAKLVQETFDRFGTAVVIDCHSMPSVNAAPDIVLGDRYGTAAAHPLLRCAEQALLAAGFKVARNVPYAGGYTTSIYGRPAKAIHALQIEVNRALYLDEERITPNPRFDRVASRLTSALERVVTIDAALLRPHHGMGIAAE
jgi:N-formylglutamate deformylase